MSLFLEKRIFLFEIVIKNLYIDERLLNSSIKCSRVRIQCGKTVDSEIHLNNSAERDEGINVNDIRRGLSFLLHASDLVGKLRDEGINVNDIRRGLSFLLHASDLVGSLFSEPIRITLYKENEILGTNRHFLNRDMCQDILVLSNSEHVHTSSYCGAVGDVMGQTIGAMHVSVRITKMSDVTEFEFCDKNGVVEYKSNKKSLMASQE